MRQPKPWFRASKQAWYVEHHGRQVRLGEHPVAAPAPRKTQGVWNTPKSILDAFYKLMASDPADLPKPDRITVAVVCDAFLSYSEHHNDRATYDNYKHFLQSLCDLYGSLLARDLKPIHITRWLDAHPSWDGGRRNAVIVAKRAFNWADRQGY
jgi:integrase/recombinase XerD